MIKAETIRRHPFRSAAVISAAGIFALEIIGLAQNPNYATPEKSCASPWASSKSFKGEDVSTLLQTDTGAFTSGITADGKVPHGAYGIKASFKAPGDGSETFDHNASRMIKGGDAGKFTLKMAIGSGDVNFGVQVIAPEGSALCEIAPQTNFTYKNSSEYFHATGQIPWLNPANLITNTL